MAKEEEKELGHLNSMSWAKRLKNPFGIDIQTCSKCGRKIKIICIVEKTHVILIRLENFYLNEIPAFAGMTDLQE